MQGDVFVYRLLRQGEVYNPLSAKKPVAQETVFDHVLKGSNAGFQSQFISTCADLSTVRKFASKSAAPGIIVKINISNLDQNRIIDLQQQNVRNLYTNGETDDNINKFNNFAKCFKEVLLIGSIPKDSIEVVK